jgi:hypothetical protein
MKRYYSIKELRVEMECSHVTLMKVISHLGIHRHRQGNSLKVDARDVNKIEKLLSSPVGYEFLKV